MLTAKLSGVHFLTGQRDRELRVAEGLIPNLALAIQDANALDQDACMANISAVGPV